MFVFIKHDALTRTRKDVIFVFDCSILLFYLVSFLDTEYGIHGLYFRGGLGANGSGGYGRPRIFG